MAPHDPEARRRPSTLHPLSIALVLALVTGCTSSFPLGSEDGEGVPPITELPRALTPTEEDLLEASNAFGFDLLREIVGESPDSTHFISPFSASMALGMALNGADGETFEQMRATLRFEGLEKPDINQSYRALLELLTDLDSTVSFQVANAVWHDVGWEPLPSYLADVEEYFDAVVEAADFDDPATPGIINDWVHEHTGGRIDGIVPDPIPADVIAYLLNAIHFQGDWTYQFDPADTSDGEFHLGDGTTETVQFMTRRGGFRFAGTEAATVLELPYGGDAFAMTIVLPHLDTTLQELVQSLDAASWADLVASLPSDTSDRHLRFPRFTLDWDRSLKPTLAALGMPIAFTRNAEFTRMFDDSRIYISDVRQKTWVQVDEEGTEAAAVTSVEMGLTSMPPTVSVDRPFLFAIRERLSGTILFLGAVIEAPLD